MKVPKYIEKKILQRAAAQMRANSLQKEIENWCKDHNIELTYCISHVCLFTEPGMVALTTKHDIEER